MHELRAVAQPAAEARAARVRERQEYVRNYVRIASEQSNRLTRARNKQQRTMSACVSNPGPLV